MPVVAPGLNAGLTIESGPSRVIDAIYTCTVEAPALAAAEWVVFAARPPDLPGQRVVSVASDPRSEVIADLGPLRQPLLRMRNHGSASRLAFEVRVQAELSGRRLAARTPMNLAELHGSNGLAAAPGGRERGWFLRRTSWFDHESPAVRDWIVGKRLIRGGTEGEVDFARRVFQTIAREFHYEYSGDLQDRSAGAVCTAGKSDCGGLCVLFVTVLRSQGIPARMLAGRWALSAKPGERVGSVDYFQEHVKAEFFAQGVGWVPADPSSAVLHDRSADKLRYFGNDPGDFLTLHVDPDLTVDTVHFGIKSVSLLQKPAYWAAGGGTFDGAVVREGWRVEAMPRP
jgi:hypothetical protein